MLAVQFFGDPIARRLVAGLSERYPARIEVGTYDLSFFRSFPRFSVDLHAVHLSGSDGSSLLTADRVGCVIPLSSLFGRVVVHGLRVEGGSVQLLTDEDGNTNYQLAGYTPVGEAPTDTATVRFALREARLNDVRLRYLDRQLDTELDITVIDGRLNGDFGAGEYLLNSEADVQIQGIQQGGVAYLGAQRIRIAGNTTVNRTTGRYGFGDLRFSSGDLDVTVDGSLQPLTDGLRCELQLAGTAADLDDLIDLIPAASAGPLAAWETDGNLSLTAAVNGDWTATAFPRLEGEVHFTDGRIGSPRTQIGARDIDMLLGFDYEDGPRGGVQTFRVKQLAGNFKGEPFRMSLDVVDLADPTVALSASGSFPLAVLPAVFDGAVGLDPEGGMHVTNLRISGKYADMSDPRRMHRVASAGIIEVDDAGIRLGDGRVDFPYGTLKLADNRVMVENLQIHTGESDLILSGSVNNYLPVLLADSLNRRDASLVFEGNLRGRRLDIDEWLRFSTGNEISDADTPSEVQDSIVRSDRRRRSRLTEFLDGSFAAEVAEWNWERMEGKDFSGRLEFYRGQLEVRGLTRAMEGEWRVEASTFFRETTHSAVRLTARGVDAGQFFYQMDNFGQEVLTDRHLRGRMDADLVFDLYYDEQGAFDYDRFTAIAGLDITEGELHDFPLLENFAFALKSEDLERVRFTRLSNYVEIMDQTVYLPMMFIQSSAINLTLSGNHRFDQQLEYFIRVNAGQVITNKLRRHDRQLAPLPARNGLFNLYYTIDGPLEDYTVATDKLAVLADFRRSEYRRNRIKARLVSAFERPIQLLDDTDTLGDRQE